jgi:phage gpG-like protein
MKQKRVEFPDFASMQDGWKKYLQSLPIVVSETAVNFFKDSFNRQGFIDKAYERWTPRKDKLAHKILMKSLYLQNSIRVIEANYDRIEVGVSGNIEYAQIHNEGGKITASIPITAKSKKFFWYMFKKTEDEKWKHMALTKKTHFQMSATMPKRQFIGSSEFLFRRLETNHNKTVKNIIESHFK